MECIAAIAAIATVTRATRNLQKHATLLRERIKAAPNEINAMCQLLSDMNEMMREIEQTIETRRSDGGTDITPALGKHWDVGPAVDYCTSYTGSGHKSPSQEQGHFIQVREIVALRNCLQATIPKIRLLEDILTKWNEPKPRPYVALSYKWGSMERESKDAAGKRMIHIPCCRGEHAFEVDRRAKGLSSPWAIVLLPGDFASAMIRFEFLRAAGILDSVSEYDAQAHLTVANHYRRHRLECLVERCRDGGTSCDRSVGLAGLALACIEQSNRLGGIQQAGIKIAKHEKYDGKVEKETKRDAREQRDLEAQCTHQLKTGKLRQQWVSRPGFPLLHRITSSVSLGCILLSSAAINNHHNVLAATANYDGRECSGSIMPREVLSYLHLDNISPGAFANTVFLAGLLGHVFGMTVLFGGLSFGVWLLGGVLAALGLGLFAECPFHSATLDFMPWMVLTTAVLASHVHNKDISGRHVLDSLV